MRFLIPDIQGWTTEEECFWLWQQAHNMQTIVEIGSWRGKSSICLARGCPGIVFCVDHWLGSEAERDTTMRDAKILDIYAEFLENTKDYQNIFDVRKDSVEAASDFDDKSIDMIFIDGGHQKHEVLADIKAWLPKCKKLFCGHDYPLEGVRAALDELALPVQPGPNWLWFMKIESEEANNGRRRSIINYRHSVPITGVGT